MKAARGPAAEALGWGTPKTLAAWRGLDRRESVLSWRKEAQAGWSLYLVEVGTKFYVLRYFPAAPMFARAIASDRIE
jgi:hypothetical protein